MDVAAVRGNLARVREAIAVVQAREGLTGAVQIIGVTKGHPAAAVTAALEAGLGAVGENRVQEALAKQEELPETRIDWHLIGHLQTNKAKFVPGRFALVHSVDSMRLGEALGRAAERVPGLPPIPVLLQVNLAGESQKSGCAPEEAGELAAALAAADTLDLRGLMTMAPLTDREGEQRAVFGALRTLRDEIEAGGLDLPELSMGMSGDYLAAVAEGATMVRLGTVLFGERQ